eukprot:8519742-Ditylum_brightwellii.AAC.1
MSNATVFEDIFQKFSVQHLDKDEVHADFKGKPQAVHLLFKIEELLLTGRHSMHKKAIFCKLKSPENPTPHMSENKMDDLEGYDAIPSNN